MSLYEELKIKEKEQQISYLIETTKTGQRPQTLDIASKTPNPDAQVYTKYIQYIQKTYIQHAGPV